jgi:transposase
MAAERVSMRKTKEILRLHFGMSLTKRQVARSCNISHSTVADYVRRAEAAGIGWPLPEGLDEAALEAKLFPGKTILVPLEKPFPQWKDIHKELKRKGVTLQLLWIEYKQQYPEGYQYSRFCELYQRWAETLDLSLRQEYRAGEKLFVDFAGKGIEVINPLTGEIKEAEIFVAVLGASNYTYAEALESQDIPSWINAHIHAFEYFGGVARITIPDNLKSAVLKTCRYEPDLSPTYQDMAEHYGTAVIPARVRKPKDKAKVEAGVLLVTRWITAALRHHAFFSIREVNDKVMELLERLNTRKFKKLDSTRRELFETIDKPSLLPLPQTRYQYAEWKKARVHIDYHIEVDRHFYSVPCQLVRKQVEVRLTAQTMEVLYKGNRIATHRRSYEKGRFTTLPEHRPEKHRKYYEWTPSRIIQWAEKTGPETAAVVEHILTSRAHPEQGYRSCLGIFSLAKKYSQARVEAACRRAVAIKAYSYKSVKSILDTGFDQQPLPEEKEVEPIEHENIRGEDYYC